MRLASSLTDEYNWRTITKIQASGVRTGLAVVVPFFIGQAIGQAQMGLVVGLGGLYVCIADKYGAKAPALLVTMVAVAVAAFFGMLLGPHAYAAVPAMFVWAFVLGLAGAWGDLPGNIGYVATFVFALALGLPPLPHFHGVLNRVFALSTGGLWATCLSIVLWRVRGARSAAEPPGPEIVRAESFYERLKANLTFRSSVFQHALRLGTASMVAVGLYKGFHIEHGYWLILTVLVIVKPEFAATRQRAGERIFGSVVGGAIGTLLVAWIHNVFVLDALLLICCVLAYSHSPDSYGLFVTFLTPFVVLMINIAAPGNWEIALVRISNTLLGGAIALVVAYLLRPRETPVTPKAVVS